MDAFAVPITTGAMYKNPSGTLVFFKYINALAMNYNELLWERSVDWMRFLWQNST